MGDEARAGRGSLDRLADRRRIGTGRKVDVDDRRQRQIGLRRRPGRASARASAADRSGGTCSTRVTPGAARAAAIAAGALAAPSAIWIE